MKARKIALWVGIVIVVVTHVYMLVAGLPASQITAHSIFNLVAAGLIVFSAM